MSYHHLSEAERYHFEQLFKAKRTNAQIATITGRSKSTISRERKRNACEQGRYRAQRAHLKALKRAQTSRNAKRVEPALLGKALDLLQTLQYSPEQIASQLPISHETLYRHIYANRVEGGDWYTHLRQKRRTRRHRARSPERGERRGRLPDTRPISQRPAHIEQRAQIGHWECDTMISSKSTDALITLVERKTRFGLIGVVAQRTARVVSRAIVKMLKPYARVVKTLTFDNGKEFAEHSYIDKKLHSTSYFAKPYASWQRGSNENFNGLVRQYFPKKQSFKNVKPRHVKEVQDKLNTRPRKTLGFTAPIKPFTISLKRVALRS